MSARDRILSRIRKAEAPAAEHLAAPVPGIASLEGAARIERFCAQVEAASATLSRLDSFEALPAALADELRQRNLPAAIRMGADPDFAHLDFGGLEVSHGPGRIKEPATLSRATFGMAETGSLVLLSGPDNPVTLTFLGETHFAVLHESDVKAGFEDVFAGLRAAGHDPRTVNFVTGPSRSADIGQTLQLGAHGPVALHVFLVAGGAG